MAEMEKKESKVSTPENVHFWRFPTSLRRRSMLKTKPQSDDVGCLHFSTTNPEFTRY